MFARAKKNPLIKKNKQILDNKNPQTLPLYKPKQEIKTPMIDNGDSKIYVKIKFFEKISKISNSPR
jgi:hypothetical protein